jgi:hypothetical protein
MNQEQIIELAFKAGFVEYELDDGTTDAFDKRYEKFAELIVQECILTIKMGITRDGCDTEKYQRSMKHIKQIEEHFGVE